MFPGQLREADIAVALGLADSVTRLWIYWPNEPGSRRQAVYALGAVQGIGMTDNTVAGISDRFKIAQRLELLSTWRESGDSVPERATWSRPLRMVHGLGLLAILFGFFALANWSSILASRFSLTADMAQYNQAWFEIAHGNLNPYSTVFPPEFWHNALELVMWPLAPLWYIWPHSVTLLWVQDAATAACEAIILIWMIEMAAIAEERRPRLRPWVGLLPLSGLVMLIASPWVIWIDSFDFHPEAIVLFFALLAAHSLWRSQFRRAWIAAIATLLGGAIGATYVTGIGLSALLAGRRWRRSGLAFIGLGALWLAVIWAIGADHATGAFESFTTRVHVGSPTALHLVVAMIEHPGAVLATLWSMRVDVAANLSGGAFIGLFSPWAAGISILVLLEGALTGNAGFIQPSVQNSLPVLLLIPFGTVFLLIVLATSRLRMVRFGAASFAVLAALNAIGWSATWTPRTRAQWISISPDTAATLNRVLALTHVSDEVIASQGAVGRFAHRKFVYPLSVGPVSSIPIASTTVWFIVLPLEGIETESSTAAQIQLGQIAALPNSHLVTASNGVYVFRWHPPRNVRVVTFRSRPDVPAWTLGTSIGLSLTNGAPYQWKIAVPAVTGVAAWGDYWRLHNGAFTASIWLSSHGPLQVQLWDDSTHKILVSHTLTSTDGMKRDFKFHGSVVNRMDAKAFAGSKLFRVQPVEPTPGDILELRILNVADAPASIYAVGLANETPRSTVH